MKTTVAACRVSNSDGPHKLPVKEVSGAIGVLHDGGSVCYQDLLSRTGPRLGLGVSAVGSGVGSVPKFG